MRTGLFFGVVAFGIFSPWWLFLVAATIYLCRYTGYELLAFGILLDLSVGVHTIFVPFPCAYTVGLATLFLLVRAVAPRLFLSQRAPT